MSYSILTAKKMPIIPYNIIQEKPEYVEKEQRDCDFQKQLHIVIRDDIIDERSCDLGKNQVCHSHQGGSEHIQEKQPFMGAYSIL